MYSRFRTFLLALLFISFIGFATVQSDEPPAAPASQPVDPKADREAKLKEQLTGVVLRGTFQMTNADGLAGKAPLTRPSVERYEIATISKGVGDNWVITARIQYADRDVQVPVPVRIVWAAGTPIITLDKMKIPLIGEYSARVVIDDGFYAGTWRGATYGGVLSGQILKKADEAAIETMEREGWDMRMPKSSAKEPTPANPQEPE